MNEDEFEYEVADGWYSTFRTWAPSKFQAYLDLSEYLKKCGDDPEQVTILNCYVTVAEGEEG